MSDENSQPQVNLVKHVRADGRRMYEWQAKLAIVREACAPGVSLAKVALKHGLNANLVRRWVVKHRAQATHLAAQSVPALLPVFHCAGVTPLRLVAEALAMKPDEAAAIWAHLPWDDRAIGRRLGLSGLQVLNARTASFAAPVMTRGCNRRPPWGGSAWRAPLA